MIELHAHRVTKVTAKVVEFSDFTVLSIFADTEAQGQVRFTLLCYQYGAGVSQEAQRAVPWEFQKSLSQALVNREGAGDER